METDVPVNTGENGNSTWLPDIMSSISTQQEETTFWDEVGTDWRTGVYILAGIRKFLKNYKKFDKRLNRYRPGLETCPQAKTSKSGHAIFLFFLARPSDEYDSAPSRKYSRLLLDVFACIG